MTRFFFVAVVVVSFLGSFSGCDRGAPSPSSERASGSGKAVVVRVVTANAHRVDRIVELTGTLAGAEEVVVSAEVDGRVEKIVCDLGDVVREGGALVQLAREAPILQVAQADAEYAAALARVGVADAQLDEATPSASSVVRRAQAERDEALRSFATLKELAEKDVAATGDVDAAAARVAIAEASFANANEEALAAIATAKARRAALGLARKRAGDTTIKSPVDGVVAARLVGIGELVRAGQPIARVVVQNTLKLRADVSERYADVIRKGLALDVVVDENQLSARGIVGRVGPLIDQASRTFPIEAVFANEAGRLKPGMFAHARVVTGADEDAIALPETALSNLPGVSKVYVVDDDNKARERLVTVLRKEGSDLLVSGELRAGERVVTTAVARLFPGAAVEVDTEEGAMAVQKPVVEGLPAKGTSSRGGGERAVETTPSPTRSPTTDSSQPASPRAPSRRP